MQSLYPILKQLWLVWLVLLFAGIVVWAMWPGHRQRFEQAARIPFEEDR
jgi:cytochrome c oxidase cbb3-type subunit 4